MPDVKHTVGTGLVFPGRRDKITKRRELYFDVQQFRNKQTMYAMYRTISESVSVREMDFDAIVMPLTTISFGNFGKETISSKLGDVLFHRIVGLGTGSSGAVVAHEALHMATTYCRRVRYSLTLGREIEVREERLADIVQDCVTQLDAILGVW